jgi:hypothetical protein
MEMRSALEATFAMRTILAGRSANRSAPTVYHQNEEPAVERFLGV